MHLKHNFIGQRGYARTWKNYNLFYKHLVFTSWFGEQAPRAASANAPCVRAQTFPIKIRFLSGR